MTTTPPEDPNGPPTPPPPPAGQPGQPGPGATAHSGYGTTQPPLSDSDQRLWATLAHAGGIIFGFLAPLIIWLIFKDRGRYVDEQSKEALNWQITLLIAYVVGSILTAVLIGLLILVAAWIAALVLGIMAAMAANRGDAYRYPFALRLIK